MTSGQPGPRGDLNVTTSAKHFPSSYDSLHTKTLKQEKLRDGVDAAASGTEYTAVRDVSMVEGFTVYYDGTGDWNVEVSADQGNAIWIKIQSSDITGDGYISSIDPHGWIRVVLRNSAQGTVWLYKKYSTY